MEYFCVYLLLFYLILLWFTACNRAEWADPQRQGHSQSPGYTRPSQRSPPRQPRSPPRQPRSPPRLPHLGSTVPSNRIFHGQYVNDYSNQRPATNLPSHQQYRRHDDASQINEDKYRNE